jgi:hypothetical protein
MENLQSLLPVAFELLVTVFVVSLVWTTVVAGLYQLVREWIHQIYVTSQRPAQERYVQRTDTGAQVAHPQPTAGP